jgi:23S rRNA pseudouridine2457 synthase
MKNREDPRAPFRYLLFYKPYGVLTAFTDPEGRPTLKDWIPVPDVYPAGRLDMDSEGLLFLSNDGVLMHRLTDPRYQHPKTYLVQVEGIVSSEALAKLRRGVEVKGRQTRRCQAMVIPEPDLPPRSKPVTPHGPTTWLRIVLSEGKKRQIRHMTAAVGHPTLRLVRVAIGPLTLEGLSPGEWRDLTAQELTLLKRSLRLTDGQIPAKSAGNARESRYRSAARQSSNHENHPSDADDPAQE